jgi:hypothetical protein
MVNFSRCETQARRLNAAATKLRSSPSLLTAEKFCDPEALRVPAGVPVAELKIFTMSLNG